MLDQDAEPCAVLPSEKRRLFDSLSSLLLRQLSSVDVPLVSVQVHAHANVGGAGGEGGGLVEGGGATGGGAQ
jgi:hypothetical protein